MRGLSLSYGQFTVNGGFIRAGEIASNDGTSIRINLNTGYAFGRFTFAAGSSGYANLSDKPDLSIFATQSLLNSVKDDLQNQIDGSITSWFYATVPTLANAPAVDWNTTELKNQHLGDLHYNTATGYAYRFQLSGGVYSWERITDTDITLALANAATAQATADSKIRMFSVTPYTPYDIGDLWADGANLYKAVVDRASGVFNAADWELATAYTDDTIALAAKGITDNFTQIDGGLISSNTIKLGTLAQDVAGVTGVGITSDSIRFWAGQTYANRGIAPFRVDQSGNLWATNANITGTINATAGSIAGVTINATDQFSLNGSKVEIFPNAGMRVFGGGYAEFTGSLKIPTSSPGSPAAGHLWAVDAVAAGSAPVNYANLYSLLDVNIGGQTNGQALVWDSSTSKWVAGTVAASSVDLSNYYTKSESDGRFLNLAGGTLTGALTGTSATFSGYLFASNMSVTGYHFSVDDLDVGTPNALMGKVAGSDAIRRFSAGYVQTFLGLGSNAYNSTAFYHAGNPQVNITGNAATATNVANLGTAYVTTTSQFTPTELLGVYSNGYAYKFPLGGIQAWLGLGSNAYSSTAYLPQAGGTVTGFTRVSHAMGEGNGFEVIHNGLTQGISIGYNTIKTSGTNADQSLTFYSQGAGIINLVSNTQINGITNLLQTLTAVDAVFTGPASFGGGSNVTTGTIRIPNGGSIYSRFSDGTANRHVISYGSHIANTISIAADGTPVSIGGVLTGTSATLNSSGYTLDVRNSAENLKLIVGAPGGGVIKIQGRTISGDTAYPISLNPEGGDVNVGGALTAPSATFSTRLTIPTSAPGSPVAGDLWMVAV